MSSYGGLAGTGGSGSGGDPGALSEFFDNPNTGNPGLLRAFPHYAMPNLFNSVAKFGLNVSSTGGVGDGVSLAGGGAGGGGGCIMGFAKYCSGTLTISAKGGNGVAGSASNLGGGAGGPGGLIILVTSDINGTNNFTFNVSGGTGGAGGGGAGTAGGDGGTGHIYLFSD